MGQQRLLIFTRLPIPGQTKTRLIPALGQGGAALLQRRLTEHIVELSHQVSLVYPIAVTVVYTGGSESQMVQWLGQGLDYWQQHSGNLGDRLQAAFQAAFDQGSQTVIVVGIDCPFITGELLQTAFNALQEYDVVIGPALDGGYYLLGLNTPRPDYFQHIDWSTPQVYDQTLAKIQQNGDRLHVLPPLPDIDHPTDLEHLKPQFSHWLAELEDNG
ncbi:MAG: TIGR04282 family arsenosugar biosynthesis glycosyltransferase [Synechocystis sp.]|nr:TIGR04282 family arsenosugar biosynthesis glycosyltransferase [Synechocystis sp.]